MPDDIVQRPGAAGTAPAAAKPVAPSPPASTQPVAKAKKAAEPEPVAAVMVAHDALKSLAKQFESLVHADTHRSRQLLAEAAIAEIDALTTGK